MAESQRQKEAQFLHRLARLYGIQQSYYNVFYRRRRQASIESLLAMLRALGAPVATLQDVPSALREKRQAIWQRVIEPVVVVWGRAPARVTIRLPAGGADAVLDYRLKLETGEERQGKWVAADGRTLQKTDIEGAAFVLKDFSLSTRLPYGYHRLTLKLGARQEESLVISAPIRAYNPETAPEKRLWGVFLPLYALRTQKNWGSGDFSDLAELMSWLSGQGAQVAATLPLLAGFLGDEADVSPYRPVSRLFWNEFYLDMSQIPELSECPEAQALISSPLFQAEINALRGLPLVDYQRLMALKRRALEELSQCLFSKESRRLEELSQFAKLFPAIEDYARFRAVGERLNEPWHSWPQRLKEGAIAERDYDEKDRRYHLYAQWLAHQQMEAVSRAATKEKIKLYLDLPLGVHPDGYDTWCYRDAFVQNTEAGSPPDAVFTGGQNWQFSPLHPQQIREQGYQYVIAYLHHHLKYGGMLRIDHVMCFHRLFCIPSGMPASQGVYLRYPAEEFYAILALESQRHKAMIVGEDLGTVPRYVRPAMKKHGLNRMYVLRYELADDISGGIHPVFADSVASLNTHDMPPLASFWQGLDIEERLKLGLLNEKSAGRERDNLINVRRVMTTFLRDAGWLAGQEDNLAAILTACLVFLSASQAQVVLVNLEDLWLETESQNVPSTITEHPNWRHKTRVTFEEFCRMPQAIDIFQTIDKLRRQG